MGGNSDNNSPLKREDHFTPPSKRTEKSKPPSVKRKKGGSNRGAEESPPEHISPIVGRTTSNANLNAKIVSPTIEGQKLRIGTEHSHEKSNDTGGENKKKDSKKWDDGTGAGAVQHFHQNYTCHGPVFHNYGAHPVYNTNSGGNNWMSRGPMYHNDECERVNNNKRKHCYEDEYRRYESDDNRTSNR